ncbi:MAG: hypothetical protein HOO67_03750 [Candidatus Peribacteraceae bacterium]|nr:hypothetical protein [Candidatus Peribacteraceae bacterium]
MGLEFMLRGAQPNHPLSESHGKPSRGFPEAADESTMPLDQQQAAAISLAGLKCEAAKFAFNSMNILATTKK